LAAHAPADYANSAKNSHGISIFDPHFSAAAKTMPLGQKAEPNRHNTAFNGTAVPKWL